MLLDYASELVSEVPGIDIEAEVGRQWSSGIELVQQLRAANRLGATVVVALGTNGPVTGPDFAAMMTALTGAARVVLVSVHVDQPWQAEVNEVLAAGSRHYRGVVLANWAALAASHAAWFYPDGTHLPVGGHGARALARLVARAATSGGA